MDRVHRICRQSNGGHGSTGSAFTKNNVEEITIAAIAAIPKPHPAPRGGAHRVGSGGVSSTQVRATQLDKTWRLRVEVKAGPVIGVQPRRASLQSHTSYLKSFESDGRTVTMKHSQ